VRPKEEEGAGLWAKNAWAILKPSLAKVAWWHSRVRREGYLRKGNNSRRGGKGSPINDPR